MLSAKQYSHVHELHDMLDNIQCTIHQGRYYFILISTWQCATLYHKECYIINLTCYGNQHGSMYCLLIFTSCIHVHVLFSLTNFLEDYY